MRGEYENSTLYATDTESLREGLDYKYIIGKIRDIAVFTDGLQRLALHYKTRTAHGPFFKPLFSYIKSKTDTNTEKLNHSLDSFLNSLRINKRTDDDKTLVIASRSD